MGCGSSKVQVSPAPKKSMISSANSFLNNFTVTTTMTTTDMFNVQNVAFEELCAAYDFIVAGCSKFKCPSESVAVACLASDTIPVILSSLSIGMDEYCGVQMCVLAACFKRQGRVIVFGHINMLNVAYFNSSNNSKIVYNCFTWLNQQQINEPIHFIDIPREYHYEIKACFHPNGIHAVFTEFNEEVFKKCPYVILPSTFEYFNPIKKHAIKAFLDENKGLAVVYVPSDVYSASEMPMNKLLIKYGVSFTDCTMADDDTPPITSSIFESYVNTQNFTFDSLIFQLDEFVNAKKENTVLLDEILTQIRYNVLASTNDQYILINHLVTLCWKYLNDTKYILENGLIAPEPNHMAIFSLLQDLYKKQTPDNIKAAATAEIFPGLANESEASDIDISLKLHEESLVSTGIWIRPGTASSIRVNKLPQLITQANRALRAKNDSRHINLYIQIGSHTLSLLGKPGPWKRLPVITLAYKIKQGRVYFASPFGGILYILVPRISDYISNSNNQQNSEPEKLASSDLKLESLPNLTFDATVEDVIKYPQAVYNDNTIYESTKNLKVPWGELVSKSIILTIPSKYLNMITDFDQVFSTLEKFITELTGFMNYTISRPYRIVFDIDLIDEGINPSYPITMSDKYIEDILFIKDTPTHGMFTALTLIAMSSLRDGCYNKSIEEALSLFSASIIFMKFFPSFNPLDETFFKVNSYFKYIWSIHLQIDNNIIPLMIRRIQDPGIRTHDTDEDRWIAFAEDICNISNLNLLPILENLNPLPVNLKLASKRLTRVPTLQIM